MGSRYLFIVLYVFFEHHLSRGDYRRANGPRGDGGAVWRAGAPAVLVHKELPTSTRNDGDAERISATPRASDRPGRE